VCKTLAGSRIISGNGSCQYGCSLLRKSLVSFFSLGRMGLKVKVHNPYRVSNQSISCVPGYGQFEFLDMDVRKSLLTFYE
jgi:hypothetical protein